MIRRPPRSTHCISSAASDVYKRQGTGSPASLHASIDDSPLLSSLARSPLALDARSTPSHVRAATPTAADGVSSGTAATHTPGPASGSGASPNLSSSRSAFASLPSVIDEIIHTADCEVYTFHPDMDSDPHASAEPDEEGTGCLLYTSPSPRDRQKSRMPSSA